MNSSSSWKISYSVSRHNTAVLNFLYSVEALFFCFLLAQKPYTNLASLSSSLILLPSSNNSEVFFFNWERFSAASLEVISLGRERKSLIRSIGRADNPTPPKQTKRNHPRKAINPITKMGNDTGRLRMVLELTWEELKLA